MWGGDSKKAFIAVHGNMSNKTDTVINMLSQNAVSRGYQVLSFDLPEHGDRKNSDEKCVLRDCIADFNRVMSFAKERYTEISLFACSLGAYFSLMAWKDISFGRCLFLSPVVDMARVTERLMECNGISVDRLREEKSLTAGGISFNYDYYEYIKNNPVNVWNSPTAILYGKNDDLCEYCSVYDFSEKFKCFLYEAENCGHFFHTENELNIYKKWLEDNIEGINRQ